MRKIASILKSKKGYVLILTICIMALLFAMGAGMLVSATSALNSVEADAREEQAWQYAYSLGRLAGRQIEGIVPKGGVFWELVQSLEEDAPDAACVSNYGAWSFQWSFSLKNASTLLCQVSASGLNAETSLTFTWMQQNGGWVYKSCRAGGELT